MSKLMKLNLKVWRQKNTQSAGNFEEYKVDASPDMSFLEMFDVLNEQLIETGKEPVAFDHDCREGICGMCSMVIDGRPHGPKQGVTTCQLHMRSFNDGDTITVEPWKNASAMLFVGAKVTQLSMLPQGKPERQSRVVAMVNQMDAEGFGACTNTGACAAECPKQIPLSVIATLNREYISAKMNGK